MAACVISVTGESKTAQHNQYVKIIYGLFNAGGQVRL